MKRLMKIMPIALLSLIVCMLPVFGMEAVDTTKKGEVTLTEYPPEGAVFEFYKVASADEKMYLTLTSKFAPYADQIEINVADEDHSKAQAVWAETANTLASLVPGEGIEPDMTFTNAGKKCTATDLEVGLYLVLSKPIEVGNELYYTAPMLVSVPVNFVDTDHTMDPADIPYIQETEEWIYEYEINVKYGCEEIPPREYRVTKEWVNDGEGKTRPPTILVNVLKNGVLDQTITLNAANNWTATWMGEKNARYSVQEVKIPEGYQVSYVENTTVFTIRNKYKEPPNTSDQTDLKWPIIGLCAGGLVAFIAGLILMRDRKQSQ